MWQGWCMGAAEPETIIKGMAHGMGLHLVYHNIKQLKNGTDGERYFHAKQDVSNSHCEQESSS